MLCVRVCNVIRHVSIPIQVSVPLKSLCEPPQNRVLSTLSRLFFLPYNAYYVK